MTQPIESGHLAGDKSEPTAREQAISSLPWHVMTNSHGDWIIEDSLGLDVCITFRKRGAGDFNFIAEAVNSHAGGTNRICTHE